MFEVLGIRVSEPDPTRTDGVVQIGQGRGIQRHELAHVALVLPAHPPSRRGGK